MRSTLIGLTAGLLLSGCAVQRPGLDAPQVLLDVFPASTVVVSDDKKGETKHSSTYTPTDSKWGKGLDEADVFHYELRHEQGRDNSYQLRIGRGGQLYSLRGAFGESIPPQGKGNPWNDEVWQFVSVCNPYNGQMEHLSARGEISEDEARKFREAGYLDWYFIHNSGAYMQAHVSSGTITFSFDVMLDAERPGELTCMLRDRGGPPWLTFATLRIATDGITFNGRPIATSGAGGWYGFEIEFELKESGTDRGVVRMTTPDGEKTEIEVAFAEGAIRVFEWIGFSASGLEDGSIFLDNISVVCGMEGGTETLVDEDFEEYQPGERVLGMAGADEEKGAVSFVSDRQAATGKQSLEVRDVAGLDANWQPMVRLDVQSNLGGALYCPLLAEDVPDDGRTFRSVNWGFVPQLRTINRSPILYYVQTRDLGDGIIEITYVVHNFSARDDIVFEWLNAPWGGTRVTSLPYHYVSSPEGELWDTDKIEELGIKNGFNVRDTGGWNLSCATGADDSPGLALVFGRDRHLEAERARAGKGEPYVQLDYSIYRDWTSRFPGWEKRPEQAWRNYDVQVVIPRLRIAPQTTIWYRSYLVVNRKDRAIELASSLVDQVDYGLRTFDPAATPMVPVPDQSFTLFAHPVPGSMPLFAIANATTGQRVITTDPYIFVPQEAVGIELPPDHPKADYYRNAVGYSLDENNSNWERLLGYGYREKPGGEGWVQLSSMLGAEQFPAATDFHLDLWVKQGDGVIDPTGK